MNAQKTLWLQSISGDLWYVNEQNIWCIYKGEAGQKPSKYIQVRIEDHSSMRTCESRMNTLSVQT